MKFQFLLVSALAIAATVGIADAQTTRDKVRQLAHIPLSGLPPQGSAPTSGSGCAGYVSPSGREYAIMGQSNGNAIIEITNPKAPVIVGHIPGNISQWHEVCVLGQYAYATTEAGGGVQIIDLREVDNGVINLAGILTTNTSRGHTIQAIPTSKLLVVNGGDVNGLRVYDCQNPVQPALVATWSEQYVHDSLFTRYTTGSFAGKDIGFLFSGNGTKGGMYIVDFTATADAQGRNVPAMERLGYIKYIPDRNDFYCHSGALSEDRRFIYLNDEFDESNNIVADAATHIINVEDLRNPVYVKKFVNPINAIDHNSMIQDNFLMLAAYKQGLRVYNLANPTELSESGHFDTFNGSGKQFAGAWGAWAGFPSGNVIISDMNAGFFVVDPSEAKGWGAPIESLSFVNTSDPGDGIKKLRRADGATFSAVFSGLSGSVIVNLKTDSMVKTTVDVRVRIKAKTMPEKMKIYLRRSDGSEAMIKSGSAGKNFTEFNINGLPASTYVGADSSIQVRIEMTAGHKAPPNVDIDVVRAIVK